MILTPRHREILIALQLGLRHKEIGKQLFISPKTVAVHLHNMREHFVAKTNIDLLQKAREAKFIE